MVKLRAPVAWSGQRPYRPYTPTALESAAKGLTSEVKRMERTKISSSGPARQAPTLVVIGSTCSRNTA